MIAIKKLTSKLKDWSVEMPNVIKNLNYHVKRLGSVMTVDQNKESAILGQLLRNHILKIELK